MKEEIGFVSRGFDKNTFTTERPKHGATPNRKGFDSNRASWPRITARFSSSRMLHLIKKRAVTK